MCYRDFPCNYSATQVPYESPSTSWRTRKLVIIQSRPKRPRTMSSGPQGREEMGVSAKYLGEKKILKLLSMFCDSLGSSVTVSSAGTFDYRMIKLTCMQLTRDYATDKATKNFRSASTPTHQRDPCGLVSCAAQLCAVSASVDTYSCSEQEGPLAGEARFSPDLLLGGPVSSGSPQP